MAPLPGPQFSPNAFAVQISNPREPNVTSHDYPKLPRSSEPILLLLGNLHQIRCDHTGISAKVSFEYFEV